MADKLVSLVSCTRYIRNRDIWDLRWLKTRNAHVRIDLIKNKINDYKIKDYDRLLKSRLNSLGNIIHGQAFNAEISRFLPITQQDETIRKAKFLDNIGLEVSDLLRQVQNSL